MAGERSAPGRGGRAGAGVIVVDEAEAVRALRRHRDWVMSRPGIVGLGVGQAADGTCHVSVYTSRAADDTKRAVREAFGPVPVEFIETGPVERQHDRGAAPASGRNASDAPAGAGGSDGTRSSDLG